MAYGVLLIGATGTGKTYSFRNLDPATTAIINVLGKPLSFRGASKFRQLVTDRADQIVSGMVNAVEGGAKVLIIDDSGYVMSEEFMRRAYEKGYDKFTEIAEMYNRIISAIPKLPGDVIVIVTGHADMNADGRIGLKACGKMLEEKAQVIGKFTVVLRSHVFVEGAGFVTGSEPTAKYVFSTQNDGTDNAKSPAGMFPSFYIPNDMAYVVECIKAFERDEDTPDLANAEVKPEAPTESTKKRGRKPKEVAPAPTVESAPVVAPFSVDDVDVDDVFGSEATDKVELSPREQLLSDLTALFDGDTGLRDQYLTSRKFITDGQTANDLTDAKLEMFKANWSRLSTAAKEYSKTAKR